MIETERLRLRPLRPDDFEALHAIYSDPRVSAWIGEHAPEDTRAELEFYVRHQAEHGWAFWAVEERATGRFLGDCGLQPLERRPGGEVELGYDLHPDAWGRGIATEAARATLDHARDALGLRRVIAVVKPDHLASRRVLERSGLVLVGEREAYGIPMLEYEALL
jgi:[ribosomal protein S5]-alanine N-acetyltransferase